MLSVVLLNVLMLNVAHGVFMLSANLGDYFSACDVTIMLHALTA